MERRSNKKEKEKATTKRKTRTSASKRKEIAQILFCEQHKTEAEIAHMLGCGVTQISRWNKAGHWSDLRSGISISRKQQILNIYRQIDRINQAIEEKPEGERVADEKEAKILLMLGKTVETMEREVGLREIVNTGKKFCEFMADLDVEKAQEVNDYWDAFVTSQISKIK